MQAVDTACPGDDRAGESASPRATDDDRRSRWEESDRVMSFAEPVAMMAASFWYCCSEGLRPRLRKVDLFNVGLWGVARLLRTGSDPAPGLVATWARYEMKMYARSVMPGRSSRSREVLWSEAAGDRLVTRADTVIDAAAARQMLEVVESRLSENGRTVLRARFFEERPVADLVSQLGFQAFHRGRREVEEVVGLLVQDFKPATTRESPLSKQIRANYRRRAKMIAQAAANERYRQSLVVRVAAVV